jgi:CBS-domain-containing membrane protein
MNYIVKDLMVPISEYATVPKGSTLFEAVLALERAQEEYDHTKYKHRAVLIMDDKNRVVGKLSQLNVLYALEPESEELEKIGEIRQFGFSQKFITHLREQYRMKGTSLKKLCAGPAKKKVEDFMKSFSEGEYIDENISLDIAIHQILAGHHLSLLVMSGEDIAGILRMSDVFAAVFHAMKENESKE